MCGIVGYYGTDNAAPVLLDGLKKLEYRGYDSAGIAVLENGKISVCRRKGRVKELEPARAMTGRLGIGHTRWATHGAPSEENAHPHTYGKFSVVHNGIIENDYELKAECTARGEAFSSATDSEVIAHLLAFYYEGDFLDAVKRTTSRLKGSYAIAVLCSDCEDMLVCARKSSPLLVGKRADGLYVASDLSAIAADGMTVYTLEEGEFAVLQGTDIGFFNADLRRIKKKNIEYDTDGETPDKKGFRHYMRKEMAEIPETLEKSRTDFSADRKFLKTLKGTERIRIVACGTAYHSGLCAKTAIEAICRVPVEVTVASEFRYLDPIVKKGTLVLAVSQSGETADTLAAAELARAKGATLAAVTNVPYSSLTRIADFVLPTNAGREVAVAATKSFNAQLMLLYCLAHALARAKGRRGCMEDIDELVQKVRDAERACEGVRGWVPHFPAARSVFFLGRGADYSAALEGSLKFKEITYLPSEGYPAGELKHGTLALVDGSTPVVAMLTDRRLAEKTMNAVHEVYARGAKVFLITSLPEYAEREEVTACVTVPECRAEFSPMLSVLPLQSLAYYVSIALGNNPDKPRNLAKSVTVE